MICALLTKRVKMAEYRPRLRPNIQLSSLNKVKSYKPSGPLLPELMPVSVA